MGKWGIHHKLEGFVTVFLSLVLLLILSLVMTVIEGARIKTAEVIAERAFHTAMDSVLAEYYGPLMKEYHILGLDTGYGDKTPKDEELTERMTEYISYTIHPGRNLAYDDKELFGITLDSVSINNKTGLTDYQGELFLNEAVMYMKYRELGLGAEAFLSKMSLLEEPKKVSVLYEEKSKVEEELVAIDEGILQLMKLLDGIATTRKGLAVNKDGNLKTVPAFVKKICYGTPTMEKVEINNSSIFQTLRGLYSDPTEDFTSMDLCLNRVEELLKRIDELELQAEETDALISQAEEVLSGLTASLSEIKDNKEAENSIKSSMEEVEDRLNNLNRQMGEIINERVACEQERNDCLEQIEAAMNKLFYLTNTLMPILIEAYEVLDRIIETAKKADPLIETYEQSLYRDKEGIGKDIYDGLKEGLQELKRYQTDNKEGYDFPLMMEILKQDQKILADTAEQLMNGEQAFYRQEYRGARECFSRAAIIMASYRIDGLKINYSTLVTERKSEQDHLGRIGSLLEEGITGLVIDPESISDLVLTDELLPSDIQALAAPEENTFSFSSLFSGMKIGNKNTGMGTLFGSFGDYSLASLAREAFNEAAEQLLFQAYLKEHFYWYSADQEELKARKPSALSYEQEYLIAGKSSDKDNLESIILRIILIRTILNFTSILGDKTKWKEAKAIASTLVGFTGLPILVAITQTILMILLAFAEALLDTCALLMGKEILLFKKKLEYGFADLLLLNRAGIRAKASSIKQEGKGLAFCYPDYVQLFLFFKSKKDLSYRAMDLIQENIRIRYEDNFTMQNCIFGFEAYGVFHMTPKFTALSFVKKIINTSTDPSYTVNAGYSY